MMLPKFKCRNARLQKMQCYSFGGRTVKGNVPQFSWQIFVQEAVAALFASVDA